MKKFGSAGSKRVQNSKVGYSGEAKTATPSASDSKSTSQPVSTQPVTMAPVKNEYMPQRRPPVGVASKRSAALRDKKKQQVKARFNQNSRVSNAQAKRLQQAAAARKTSKMAAVNRPQVSGALAALAQGMGK